MKKILTSSEFKKAAAKLGSNASRENVALARRVLVKNEKPATVAASENVTRQQIERMANRIYGLFEREECQDCPENMEVVVACVTPKDAIKIRKMDKRK